MLISKKVTSNTVFSGNIGHVTNEAPQFVADKMQKLLDYKVLRGQDKFPLLTASAIFTSFFSGLAYLFGGAGLIYDAHKRLLGGNKNRRSSPILQHKSILFNDGSAHNSSLFKDFLISPNSPSFKSADGVKNIEPQTKFAKLGVESARVAAIVAGGAGILNGMALGIPMLSLGEGVTVAAAPVIEKPMGIGIFGIGLAVINLSRVLEGDSRFVIDKVKFASMSPAKKIGYVCKNLKDTSVELFKSVHTIGVNFANLFGDKRKSSIEFFKESFFSTKPTSFVLQELVNHKGQTKLAKVTLKNPYLMHFATLILGGSSIFLIIANALKCALGEKIMLRTYNVGNAFDNIALSKWGLEAIEQNKADIMRKSAGGFFALAGVGLLASQPGIDRDWGRGINWASIGCIMMGFGLLKTKDLMRFFRNRAIKQEFTSVVRQWKFDLKEVFGAKDVKKHFDTILNVHDEFKINDEKSKEFVAKMNKLYNWLSENDSKFKSETQEVLDKFEEIFGKDSHKFITKLGSDDSDKLTSILQYLGSETKKLFGEHPLSAV